MMIRYERTNTVRIGVIGLIICLLCMITAVNIKDLPFTSVAQTYHAQFADAGGLKVADKVEISGVTVGKVTGVALEGTHVAVSFKIDSTAYLGSTTRASIVTATVLGSRNLRLISTGVGKLKIGATIPLERTTAPYDLTQSLNELTTSTGEIDTQQLAKSMAALTDTLKETPEELRAAVSGVGKVSQTIAERDQELVRLLSAAESVTSVLSQRSTELNTLILGADAVLGELDKRKETVETLFANVTSLANSLKNLVADNREELAPTLARLNTILELLSVNKLKLGKAIAGLGPYATELGEAVASGPFFNSYITNLLPGQLFQPYLQNLGKSENLRKAEKVGK